MRKRKKPIEAPHQYLKQLVCTPENCLYPENISSPQQYLPACPPLQAVPALPVLLVPPVQNHHVVIVSTIQAPRDPKVAARCLGWPFPTAQNSSQVSQPPVMKNSSGKNRAYSHAFTAISAGWPRWAQGSLKGEKENTHWHRIKTAVGEKASDRRSGWRTMSVPIASNMLC